MSAPVLQLRNIEKRFPGVHALRGVSLDVHAGEVVALLGENGAGKSTLMKIVGGIEQPDAGEVLDRRRARRDARRPRRDGARHRVHPPGAEPARQPRRRRQRPARPRADGLGASAADRPGGNARRGAALPRSARPRRLAGHAAGGAVDRAAAAGRDRQGAVAQRPPAHHGRADVEPDDGRDGPAARRRRGPARAGRGRHLHHAPARRSADRRRPRGRPARRRERRRAGAATS